MKKSYKKILIFELIMFIILLLNSFKTNILLSYNLVIFLFGSILIFNHMLSPEKNKSIYKKDIILEEIILLMIFMIFYYLFGLIIGFAKTSNYYTLYGIFKIIVPLILTIVLKEYLRSYILVKSNQSKYLIIITTILFIFIDLFTNSITNNLNNAYNILTFVSLTLLPSITYNIYASYTSLKVGAKPVILYSLVINLYSYLLPIIPDPSVYLKSIIDILLPVVFLVREILIYKKNNLQIKLTRETSKKVRIELIVLSLITIVIVYLVSGYFKYYAIAIASNSMVPVFDRGTVVIVDRKPKTIEEGDIIAYKYNDLVIVHRVVKILKVNDEIIYYTKGDANSDPDNNSIKLDDIVGVVKVKIPFIGYPTVWLSEF